MPSLVATTSTPARKPFVRTHYVRTKNLAILLKHSSLFSLILLFLRHTQNHTANINPCCSHSDQQEENKPRLKFAILVWVFFNFGISISRFFRSGLFCYILVRTKCVRTHVLRAREDLVATKLGIILLLLLIFSIHGLFSQKGFT